ncbi:MAG TPA: hypothetical protein VFC03_03460 [Acidimicrobiales bacterium]|nr:hypothetical protein [Acidimicrobiales bacterium]
MGRTPRRRQARVLDQLGIDQGQAPGSHRPGHRPALRRPRRRITAGTCPTDATAQLVSGADYEAIQQKVRAKHGFMTTTSKLLNTVGATLKGKRIPFGDRGVVITLAG